MNSKIKKAVEAILKTHFEGDDVFDEAEEAEIAKVIEAATNDGAVEMMNRSMNYVYKTEVKINGVPVTQLGFKELSKLGLYEVDSDLETMRFVPKKVIRLGESNSSYGIFEAPINGTDGILLTSYTFTDVTFLNEYGKIIRAKECSQEYEHNGDTVEVCYLKKAKNEYVLLNLLKNYLTDDLSELCDNMFEI